MELLTVADNLMYQIKKTTKMIFVSTAWNNDRSRVDDPTNH